jgi:hypothetical protein
MFRGDLYCELAFAIAGVAGGCADFELSTGQVIRFTVEDGWVSLGPGPVMVENIVIPVAPARPADTPAPSVGPVVTPPPSSVPSGTGRAGTYLFEGTVGDDAVRTYGSNLPQVPEPQSGQGRVRIVMDDVGRVTEVGAFIEVLGEVVLPENLPSQCGIGRWTLEVGTPGATAADPGDLPALPPGQSYGSWTDPADSRGFAGFDEFAAERWGSAQEMFESEVVLSMTLPAEGVSYFAGADCERQSDGDDPPSGTTWPFSFAFLDDTTLAMCAPDRRTRTECVAAPLALLTRAESA